MSYHVRVDGTVDCDTAAEALALLRSRVTPVNRPRFERQLRLLCDLVLADPHPGRGPKPVPLGQAIYDAAMRVHLGMSARVYGRKRGAVHYNTVLQYMNDVAMTAALLALLRHTAKVKPARVAWGPLMSKRTLAKSNEKLLRELVARVTTMSAR